MQTAKMTTMLPSVSALQSRPQLSCSRRAVMCVRASTSDDSGSAAKTPGQQPAQRSGRGFIRPDDAQPQPTRVRLYVLHPQDSADQPAAAHMLDDVHASGLSCARHQPQHRLHCAYQPIVMNHA